MLIIVGALLCGIGMLLVAALNAPTPTLSLFEMKRRIKKSGHVVPQYLQSAMHHSAIEALLRIITMVLFLLFSALSLQAWGWLGGVGALAIAIVYHRVVQATFLQRLGRKSYRLIEPFIVRFIVAYPRLVRFLHKSSEAKPPAIASNEELLYEIERIGEWLPASEKRRIKAGLEFAKLKARDIMTPLNRVYTVPHNELLGPLVLDELHKTGHTLFPIVKESPIDIIGILDIDNFLVIGTQHKTPTAEKAMQQPPYSVAENQSAEETLNEALTKKCSLLVVHDISGQAIGVLSIRTLIRSLQGIRDKNTSI